MPQLILFALPLLGSSLVQQLYNTADLLFVGNFAGKTAAAAVGSSGLIFTCLIGLFTGISVGVGIVIAHAWGAGRRETAERAAGMAIWIGLLGSLVLMCAGLAGARWILQLLQTPEDILAEAVTYVRIYFLSMIPMVMYNMGASILRAAGDSRTPFYILLAGGILNVLADFLLVAVLRGGVTGAAVATSISQTASAALILIYLAGKKSRIRLSLRGRVWDRALAGQILAYGLPAGIQAIVITLSNVVVQYHINGFGEDAVAAYAAYFKIETLLYLPIMACGQAVTTFTGQNYGAGRLDRIWQGTWKGLLFSCLVTAGLAALVLLVPSGAIGLFLKDKEVIAFGVSILMTTFPFYCFYAVLEVTGGALRGMGYSRTSMAVVMTGLCGLRVFLLYLVDLLDLGFYTVAKVYPVTWSVTAIAFLVIFCTIMKKKCRE